jgi:excisionase family DNA binding protein
MTLLPNRLLFPFEVATYFRVSMRTVYIWIKEKKINHIHTPGGQIRIPKESVEQFEQEKNIHKS